MFAQLTLEVKTAKVKRVLLTSVQPCICYNSLIYNKGLWHTKTSIMISETMQEDSPGRQGVLQKMQLISRRCYSLVDVFLWGLKLEGKRAICNFLLPPLTSNIRDGTPLYEHP